MVLSHAQLNLVSADQTYILLQDTNIIFYQFGMHNGLLPLPQIRVFGFLGLTTVLVSLNFLL